MKKFFIAFCLLYFSASATAQSKIDVLHYKFSIELNDKNDTIYASASIQLKILSATGSIKLDLVKKNEDGKGMIVDSITGPGIRAIVKDPDSVRIILSSSAKPAVNDTVTYIIKYHGVPVDGLIISKNKYGHRTFFADNWPNRAHNWIPCVDDPADKASVEFIVTTPSHYRVISNGMQIEEKNLPDNKKLTHYKEDVQLPTKVMVIGVADFAVDSVADVNGVPVYSWVFPENKKEGFYDYAQAKDILPFFINYIGPYPYKKLASVQSKTIFGGMENAGAIFYSENSVTGSRQHEDLLAHEISHQWFGNMVTEKNYAHLWLSEGFATYLAHIYMEAKYGRDRLNMTMKKERDEVIDFVKTFSNPVVDSLSPAEQLLNANSYQKGGWVLHMLRRQLGDSVFHQAIRTFYNMYKGQNADTEDLKNIFEKISGKNLDIFFRQWLYTAATPKLDITWKYNQKGKNVAITVKQLQQSGPFRFPLDIYIREKTSVPKIITRDISKDMQTYTFPVKSRPVKIQIDPFISLLFEGTLKEIK